MSDPKVTKSRPVADVQVAIIGTGAGSHLPTGTVAVTPGANTPNVQTTVIGPVFAIAIRFINLYLTMLLGTITAAMGTDIIPFAGFLDLLQKSAIIALVPACVGSLKDLVTIFGKLETKYPLSTGSV